MFGLCVAGRGQVLRKFKAPPIGFKPVTVVLPVQCVACRECGAVRQVAVDFADERRSYTHAFERYALELSLATTIQAASVHLGVSWDVVKEIQKRYYKRKFGKPNLSALRWLAIDEISIGSGHRYLTVVMDLETGAVVFVGAGKSAEALQPFWPRLKRARAKILAVGWIWRQPISDLRRKLHREITEKLHKDVLKGTRWLLLKNPENLNPAKDEHLWKQHQSMTRKRYLGFDCHWCLLMDCVLWYFVCKANAGEGKASTPDYRAVIAN